MNRGGLGGGAVWKISVLSRLPSAYINTKSYLLMQYQIGIDIVIGIRAT